MVDLMVAQRVGKMVEERVWMLENQTVGQKVASMGGWWEFAMA